jgi:hypothetical protein
MSMQLSEGAVIKKIYRFVFHIAKCLLYYYCTLCYKYVTTNLILNVL